MIPAARLLVCPLTRPGSIGYAPAPSADPKLWISHLQPRPITDANPIRGSGRKKKKKLAAGLADAVHAEGKLRFALST
jgi:hypothetical protein